MQKTKLSTQCPLCYQKWLKDDIQPFGNVTILCQNPQCHMRYVRDILDNFYIVKILSNRNSLWWGENNNFYVGYSKSLIEEQYSFEKLNFYPPFDLSEKQLKLYIIMS